MTGFGFRRPISMADWRMRATLLGETFQHFLVVVREGGRRRRKHFEDSLELRLAVTASKTGTIKIERIPSRRETTGINARIELGIDGKLRLASLQTGAREAVASIQRNPEIRGKLPGRSATNHFIAAG